LSDGYPDPPERATSKPAYAIKEELDADAAKDISVWRSCGGRWRRT